MKNLLLFLLTFTCINGAIAQKCNYDYEKKDPFSGKMTRGNSATLDKSWKMGFNKGGDDYSLGIFINAYGEREDRIHTGDTLVFALDGADPVILTAMQDAQPTSSVIGYNIETWYQCQYLISSADVLKISQHNIVAMKVYLGTLALVLDIPAKNSKKIQKAAACILN